ncbi:MAG: hypothetical protein ACJ8I9_10140, partial [Chthoniobacterales bacterium]
MPNQLETLRTQALALIDALEIVEPEYRALGLGAGFRRPAPAGAPGRSLISGIRQGLDDLLTAASHLSGAQLRALATELRTRHGIELDSLQQRRLRRLAAIRERGHITSEDQYYLVRSRVDEIEGLEVHTAECKALQRMAD